MERNMYRKDRQLPEAEAWALLKKGTHGVLAVVGDEGWPYAIPLNYIFLDGKVYLHCAHHGYKLDAIQRDSRVCLTVVLKSEIIRNQITTAYESIILTGRAFVVEEKAERQAVLEHFIQDLCEVTPTLQAQYIEKMGPRTTLIRIASEAITAKANRKFTSLSQRVDH